MPCHITDEMERYNAAPRCLQLVIFVHSRARAQTHTSTSPLVIFVLPEVEEGMLDGVIICIEYLPASECAHARACRVCRVHRMRRVCRVLACVRGFIRAPVCACARGVGGWVGGWGFVFAVQSHPEVKPES